MKKQTKDSKQMLFEMMHKINGLPLNENYDSMDALDSTVKKIIINSFNGYKIENGKVPSDLKIRVLFKDGSDLIILPAGGAGLKKVFFDDNVGNDASYFGRLIHNGYNWSDMLNFVKTHTNEINDNTIQENDFEKYSAINPNVNRIKSPIKNQNADDLHRYYPDDLKTNVYDLSKISSGTLNTLLSDSKSKLYNYIIDKLDFEKKSIEDELRFAAKKVIYDILKQNKFNSEQQGDVIIDEPLTNAVIEKFTNRFNR
jgi:hypothetical protein